MTLIFDYDGTVHDTAHLYGCAFRKAYKGLVNDGYAEAREYTDREMSRYLGMNAEDMWSSFMPELPPDVMKKTAEQVGKEMVNQISEGSAVLYDGIESALNELKARGYSMVILSNCHNEYLEAHRRHFQLDRWFDCYFCAESFGYIPKEEIFRYIKEQFPDNRYIVIGDRESDFRVGTVHDFPIIGCAYGFGSDTELNVCTEIIHSPNELVRAVEKLAE